MKKILIALLVCFSFVTANAKDYSKYYQNLPVQMQQPTLPSIPDNHVSIIECGGNGDGLTMNTGICQSHQQTEQDGRRSS